MELMGHVRLGGFVSEVTMFGGKVGRIDVPVPDGKTVTQFFGPSSLFRLTPTTEEVARKVAAANRPAPVHAWELQQLQPPAKRTDDDDEDGSDITDYLERTRD